MYGERERERDALILVLGMYKSIVMYARGAAAGDSSTAFYTT